MWKYFHHGLRNLVCLFGFVVCSLSYTVLLKYQCVGHRQIEEVVSGQNLTMMILKRYGNLCFPVP